MNTPKRNFRCDDERWRAAVAKIEQMRRMGYPVDMSRVLTAEVERFGAEDIDASVDRLGLAEATAS